MNPISTLIIRQASPHAEERVADVYLGSKKNCNTSALNQR